MKPISLEFCGINSFSEPAFIDFTELLEFGIFGIFGDTGSGKSTILDCIGFALYGRMTRGKADDIINYRCDKAYVRFEFEAAYGGERHIYRVERDIQRKKPNAASAPQPVVHLYERVGNSLVAVEEGAARCGEKLLSIVGMSQEDFEKCIALPQGEFAQFVKATKADRLKIIARLFDLERYGGTLVSRVNGYQRELSASVQLARARLEPYEGIGEEQNEALRKEIKELTERDEALKQALSKAREEEKRLSILADKNRQKEELSRRMEVLEREKEGMKQLAAELERLGRANAVVRAEAERAKKERELHAAEEGLRIGTERERAAEDALRALPPFDEEGADLAIAKQSELLEQSIRADGIRAAAERSAAEEKTLRARLAAVQKEIVSFDYQAERSALLCKKKELGSEDFLVFLEEHGKSVLLKEEYAAFADELDRLGQKYPVVRPDTDVSAARYRALSEGDTSGFSGLKRAFEARERAREAADKALSDLDALKARQDSLAERAKELVQRADRLAAEGEEYRKQLGSALQTDAVRLELNRLTREKRETLARRREAEERLSKARLALAPAKADAENAKRAYLEAEDRLKGEMEGVFSSAEEAASLVDKYGDAGRARTKTEQYREEYASVRGRLRGLENLEPVSPEAVEANMEELKRLSKESEETMQSLAVSRRALKEGEEKLLEKLALERELSQKQHEADLADKLKKLLGDNRFIEFVAEEFLQTVAVNASTRLLSLTGGRYFLRYDGSFFVGDNFNGGKPRAVGTLSGGETFLVSLSLALSLSAEICQRSLRPIEFFFLDEGFGTLDGHLVDVVMDSLEKLKGEHFSIGLISHVEELKHRIERKILVAKATETSGSKIKTE